MSDLQCAARIFVARHGEAAYPLVGVMTEDGGWLTDRGRAQAGDLADRLRSERLATVYTSPMHRAVQTGGIVAERLALPYAVLPGVVEFASGQLAGHPVDDPVRVTCHERWRSGDLSAAWPGGESGTQILTRMRRSLEELADRHRGEAVLVVSHGGVMSFALPRLMSAAPAVLLDYPPVDNCAVVALEMDADGCRLAQGWPASAPG
jgi:broad specificity phosphatase PhoE